MRRKPRAFFRRGDAVEARNFNRTRPRQNRLKRGGEFKTMIAFNDAVSLSSEKQIDVVPVDETLSKLESLDERQAHVVEMKFFGGLTIEEIAEVLDTTPAIVKREGEAKLLLYKMLNE